MSFISCWKVIEMRNALFFHCVSLFFLLMVSFDNYAIEAPILQKYPNVLLTKDYGILTENDLAAFTWDVKLKPFDPEKNNNYNYWQCFPRSRVSLTLEDYGYSSEDIGGIENYGNLYIKVSSNNGILHEYSMRRPWAVDGVQKIFNQWQELMKNEEYVCLAGAAGHYEKKTNENKVYITYFWTFERIKTKKGCDAYFENQCNQIYPKAKAVTKT